jgi:hypothetical protein
MQGSPGAHIIFRVHFEKADRLGGNEDVGEVKRLEADPSARRKFGRRRHFGVPTLCEVQQSVGTQDLLSLQDFDGSSEPVPVGVFIVAQVPFGTYFHALP